MITVQITIQSDKDTPMNEFELAILKSLSNEIPAGDSAASVAKTEIKKTTPAPAAKKESVKAEPPQAVVPEDVDVTSDDAEEATDPDRYELAVAEATKLVNAGKTADVKAILTDLGVKRVAELTGSKVEKFLEALGV